MRVVIAEQWSILRSGMRTVLAQGGHPVLAAVASADELFAAMAQSQSPDLVILGSLDAPSAELVQRLAALAPQVRTLVFVEDLDRPIIDGLLQAGAFGVLDHQTDGADLLDALERIHRGERALASTVIDVLVGVGPARQDAAQRHHAVIVATEGPSLTARELEILSCLKTGATNRDIADRLYIGEATVKSHLASVYEKLGVANRHQALLRAAQLGLISVSLPSSGHPTAAAAS